MHLGDAAERVRILHMGFVLSNDFTAFQEFTEIIACLDLSPVRTDLLDAIHKRIDTPIESFEGKSGNKIGFLRESEGFQNGKHTISAHKLRTIEQGKTFFTHKFHRFPAELIEDTDGFALLTFIINIAHTDKRQEEIGKRSQITGCTERTAVVDNGHHIVVEEIEDTLYGNNLHTAMPQRKGMGFQQHH